MWHKSMRSSVQFVFQPTLYVILEQKLAHWARQQGVCRRERAALAVGMRAAGRLRSQGPGLSNRGQNPAAAGRNPTGPAAAALWRSEVGERLFIRVFLDTFPFSGSLLTPSLYTNVPSRARMRAAPRGQKLSLQMSKEHGCPGSFPGCFPNMHFRKEN